MAKRDRAEPAPRAPTWGPRSADASPACSAAARCSGARPRRRRNASSTCSCTTGRPVRTATGEPTLPLRVDPRRRSSRPPARRAPGRRARRRRGRRRLPSTRSTMHQSARPGTASRATRLQRLLVVERAGQHAAGLREHALGRLALLQLGDVLDDVDGELGPVGRGAAAPGRATSAAGSPAPRCQRMITGAGLLARERQPPRQAGRARPAGRPRPQLARHQSARVGGEQRLVATGGRSSRTAASFT